MNRFPKEDGDREFIMKRFEEKLTDLWEEIIVKEQLKNIRAELNNEKVNIREIVKEELTNLWNVSEIPTFKHILEKLIVIQNTMQKKEEIPLITEEDNNKPEMVYVNVWTRSKNPILVDISKTKTKLSKDVQTVVKNLANLSKKGKF